MSKYELHDACKAGNLAEVKRLLEAGADANAVNKYGNTPLYFASSLDSTEIAELLIDAGALVNTVSKCGATTLHWVCLRRHKAMVILLINAGANIKAATKSGYTPLDILLF